MNARNVIGAALGMAPILAAFRRDGVAVLFEDAASFYDARMGYFLFLGLVCVAAPLWMHLSRRCPPRRVPVIASASAGLASLTAVLSQVLGGVASLGAVGTAALCATQAAWLATAAPAWKEALGVLSRRSVLVAIALAHLASLVPSTIGAFASRALPLLAALGPAFSAALLLGRFRPPLMEARPDAPAASKERAGRSSSLTVELPRTLLFFATLVLLGGVIRGFLNNGSFINGHAASINFTTHVISVALVAGVFGVALRTGATSRGLDRAWGVLFVFLLGSLLLIAFLSVEHTQLLPLGRSLVIAGNTCLGVLFWAFLASPSPDQHPHGGSLYVIVEALASFCSYLLTPAFAQYLGVSLHNHVLGCSLATAFVLTLAAFAFLSNTALHNGEQASPTPTPLETCTAMAVHYGLTEREVQICALIAQGHTLDAIAGQLGLSANTVRSYSKNLYRKLGVHKKQEVVELIAGWREG